MEKKAKKTLSRPKVFLLTALLVVVLTMALELFSSFRVYEAKGGSMAPTLQDGDRILFQMGASFQSGDVVILSAGDLGMVIKRVIAVGGQHVVVDYDANTVTVDGVILEEPYVPEPMADPPTPTMTLLDVTVPPGRVYVLGDNRNHSFDSRHETLGCVHISAVWGKALWILEPRARLGRIP